MTIWKTSAKDLQNIGNRKITEIIIIRTLIESLQISIIKFISIESFETKDFSKSVKCCLKIETKMCGIKLNLYVPFTFYNYD